MSYKRAEDVLPPDVLALVQMYVDGIMLYVPKKSSSRKRWGTANGTKAYYASRNAMISVEFRNGASICELAERYFLSEKSIQRIVRDSAAQEPRRGNYEPGE